MLKRLSAAAVFVAGLALGQPRELSLPKLTGDRVTSSKPSGPGTSTEIPVVKLYQSPRQAALAAFQAGYKGATAESNPVRGVRLFLVALQRDPKLVNSLYNLGILCVQMKRW